MRPVLILWKLIYRNWLFWVSLIVAIVHLALLFYQYLYDNSTFNMGNSFVMSSFIVQGGILIFIYLGIHFQSLQENMKIDYYMKTINSGFTKSITVSNIIFVSIFIISITSFSFFLFFMMAWYRGVFVKEFFLDSFFYLLLYWSCPFFISFLIGSLLSLWIQNKMVYCLAIFLAVLLGPLNYIFGSFQVLDFINLGQPDYSYSYRPLYGYPLEWYYVLKKWILLTCVLCTIFLSTIIKKREISVIKALLLILIILKITVLSILFYSSEKPISFGYDSKSPVYEEFLYYEESKSKIKEQNIVAESYDINLSLTPFSAKVNLILRNKSEKPLKTIHLSLYHQFKVSSIKLDGKQTTFKQEGDFLKIYSDKEILPKELIELHIVYDGKSSPFYMVNSQAIYLPAHFNWLPSTVIKPSIAVENSTLKRNSFEPSTTTLYKLTVISGEDIHTNLEKTKHNEYEGRNNGLTLISGELIETTVDNKKIVIPSSWALALDGVDILLKDIENMLLEISLLTGDNQEIPTKLMILPAIDIYDFSMQENYWFFNDHLILAYEPNTPMHEEAFSSDYHKQYFVHSLISAATWKKEKLAKQDNQLQTLFDAYFANWFYKKSNWKTENNYFSNLISLSEEEINETSKKRTIKKINKFMISNEYEKQFEFLKLWYELSLKNPDEEWDMLSIIIEDFL